MFIRRDIDNTQQIYLLYLRSCLKTLMFNIFKLELSQERKETPNEKLCFCFVCFFPPVYTKIYHIYHTFVLIWYLLESFITVLAGHARLLAFQVFSKRISDGNNKKTNKQQNRIATSESIWRNRRPLLFTWQARKAYCKQLNPHSFILKSNKQTKKTHRRK